MWSSGHAAAFDYIAQPALYDHLPVNPGAMFDLQQCRHNSRQQEDQHELLRIIQPHMSHGEGQVGVAGDIEAIRRFDDMDWNGPCDGDQST